MDGLRVLVLEDDENLRELLCETLEDEGYVACGAANGAAAVQQVTREAFDVMIVDVRMEGMSGLETFAHVRQQGVELACLVITGYATEEDSIRAIRLGVGDYLRKPFEINELLQRLARVAAVHLRSREAAAREGRWQRQSEWLHEVVHTPPARAAGALARRMGLALGLEPLARNELAVAASLAQQGLHPQGAGDHVAEALDNFQEQWNGGGPGGKAGDAIPLAARVARLACLAADTGLGPAELASRYDGIIDPHLLFALEEPAEGDERGLRRLVELARGLLASGQTEQAAQALRQVEPLAGGALAADVQLLLAAAEPPALAAQRLQTMMDGAATWSARERARTLAQGALLLAGSAREQAVPWTRRALDLPQPPEVRASLQLAWWSLGQLPPGTEWSPSEALELLLQPQHEPAMFRILPWLGPALLNWWLQTPAAAEAPAVWRWLRHTDGALAHALLGLSAAQRSALLARLQQHPGRAPRGVLQLLAQAGEGQEKILAQQLARAAVATPVEAQATPPLHIRSFGSFGVFVGGRPVADKQFRGGRNKMVLAYLCASPRPLPEERLRETFWPEELEKGRKGLANALFHVRKALKPEAGGGDSVDYLARSGELLGLDLELQPWHDLWEVEKCLSRLKITEWPALAAEVDALLGWTEEPYLDGCYMDWAAERRESLEVALSEAIWAACVRAVAAQAWQQASDWSARLLQRDPAHQKAAALRMQALCGLKRPEEALRVFAQVQRKAKQEYDLDPSTELLEWATRAKLAV